MSAATSTRPLRLLAATLALALALAGVVVLSAQDAASTPPSLPEAQRLKIVALRQEVEIYRLRQQLAALELQRALQAAARPGYRLTDQLTYEPIPASSSAGTTTTQKEETPATPAP